MLLEDLLEEKKLIASLKFANTPSLKYLEALRRFVTKLEAMKDEISKTQQTVALYIEVLLELKEYEKCRALLEEKINENPNDPIIGNLTAKYVSITKDGTTAAKTANAILQEVFALQLETRELIDYINILKDIDLAHSIAFLQKYIKEKKIANVKIKLLLATLYAQRGAYEKCYELVKQVEPRIAIPRDLSTFLFALKDFVDFNWLKNIILIFENKSFFKELVILLCIKRHHARDIDYVLGLYTFTTEHGNLSSDCRLLAAQFNLVKEFDFSLGQRLAASIRENYSLKQIRSVTFLDVNLIFHDQNVAVARKNSFFDLLSMEKDWIFLHEQWGSFDRVNVKDLIDDKFNTFLLADIWGIKRPEIYDYGKSFSELTLRNSVVLKPVAGAVSKGIFIIYNENEIHDLYGKKWLKSTKQLSERIDEYLQQGTVRRDQWFLEELITNDSIATKKARDIKFYCFYGKCLLALESQRDDKVLRCWYDRSGHIVDTGKYSNSAFEGKGIDRSHFEMAESISSKLPMPFVRVDFLQANQQTYLGELTPIPSDSETLSTYCDGLLGSALSAANIDLREDLMFNREKFFDFYRLVSYVK